MQAKELLKNEKYAKEGILMMTNPNENATDSIIQLRDIKMNGFTTSISFCEHPLMKTRKKTKLLYFAALEYFTKSCAIDNEYVDARLSQYRKLFVEDDAIISLTCENCDATIKTIMDDFLKPWKREYRSILLRDIALIILDKTAIKKVCHMMSKYLNARKQERLKELLELFFNDTRIPPLLASSENLIAQFRVNRNFASQKIMCIIVTANMSAGKSTLINALVGRPVTKTAQEACTTDLCHIYNKPFDDGVVHLMPPLNLRATLADLTDTAHPAVSYVATFFHSSLANTGRMCIIDTPGVNSAINRQHGRITRKALQEELYDTLVYILTPNKLGTDEEIRHLKWVAENVPKEKVIFVLNKLDDFKTVDDNIHLSIQGARNDLLALGYENPTICPLSAYFAYLIKLKESGAEMHEDEIDAYDLFVKKFSKPAYDLSGYYPQSSPNDMSVKCGIYGFEKIIFGGSL